MAPEGESRRLLKEECECSTTSCACGRRSYHGAVSIASSHTGDESVRGLKTKVLGALSLVMVVVTWVGGSEVTQAVQDKEHYNKPFFIAYFNHSSAVCILLVQGGYSLLVGTRPIIPRILQDEPKLSLLGTVAALAVIFLLADFLWFVALSKLAVDIATVLFNTSCVFTYILSVLFLNERLCVSKVLAVLLAVGGVMVIAFLQDTSAPSYSDHTVNDTAAPDDAPHESEAAALVCIVCSAFLYGVYEIVFKTRTKQWEHGTLSSQLIAANWLMFLVALFTVVVALPGLWLMGLLPHHWLFYEEFVMPTSSQVPGVLAGAAGAVGFNVFFGLSLALLSPVIVSVGCALTIPVSALTDFVLHGSKFNGYGVLGSVLILAAFCAVCQQRAHKPPPPHFLPLPSTPPPLTPRVPSPHRHHPIHTQLNDAIFEALSTRWNRLTQPSEDAGDACATAGATTLNDDVPTAVSVRA